MNLRRLNADGLRQFADYLAALKTTPALPPPVELLTDAATSEEAAPVAVAAQSFTTRLEAGRWLHELIERAAIADPARDNGLWAWLSLLLFDAVCPADGNGHRKPGELARQIPDVANFQRYYRHLLAGPWRMVRAHRDDPMRALVVLHNPVNMPGDLAEQVMARQAFVTNRTAMAAATKLYIDSQTGKRKPGAAGRPRARFDGSPISATRST